MTEIPENKPRGTEEDGDFDRLLTGVRRHFATVAGAERPLFRTDAPDLFVAFLDGLPPSLRQEYTCSCCRRFVTRFGSLAVVDEDGRLSPAVWPAPDEVPERFHQSVEVMRARVAQSKITGVFLTALPEIGVARTGDWKHLALPIPAERRHRNLVSNAGQVAAEKRQDLRTLERGLDEFPVPVMMKALTHLTSGNLYRSDKAEGMVHWLLGLQEMRATTPDARLRENRLWTAVALAPAGFCHVRTNMIGTLLEDIVADLPFESLKSRWDTRMSPSNYMRAQAAPTAGNIAQAEKIIATLKASGSLDRRYARLAELDRFLWRAPAQAAPAASVSGGVFGHLTPKKAPVDRTPPNARTITWEDFLNAVLPEATRIEAQIPPSPDRFMALVTAVNPQAPPILQWDSEDERNPMSWYYAAGIDAEIKRRVLAAGGTHEGCDIRVSLLWNNRNDLDLHVVTPAGEHIYFGAKKATCGGWLDVDMNIGGETDKPVENIRWIQGAARPGRHRIYVQNYRFHEKLMSPTPFRIELEVNGEVFHHDGVISPERQTRESSDVVVTEFDFTPGRKLDGPPRSMRVPNENGAWNVTPGQWVPVTAVALSPNLWGTRPLTQHGRHVFFLLQGCRDTRRSAGRPFFVETLRSDFHPIRSTMEAYAASAVLGGAEEADACGLGMTDQAPWNLLLRVTSERGVNTYLIERWSQ